MTASDDPKEAPDAPERDSQAPGDDRVGVSYPAVARVASRSELRMVRLRSLHSECNPRPEHVPETWNETAFVGFRASITEAPADDGRFRSEVSFLALFDDESDLSEVGLEGLDEDYQPEVVVEATFELEYTLSPEAELQENDLEQFALANSTLHAWPYWRELAQSLSTRMAIPPLVIGTYKMPYAHDPKD